MALTNDEPKPAFDPTQPFSVASDEKPPFDPSLPFNAAPADNHPIIHQLLNAVRVGGADVAAGVENALSGLATKISEDVQHPDILQRGLEAVAPDPFGVRGKNKAAAVQSFKDVTDYWANRAKSAPAESAVDPALENTAGAKSAHFLAGLGVMLGEGALPEVGVPLMLSHNALQRYGETYNATGDADKAQNAMNISLLGNGLFLGQGGAIEQGLNKVLPQGASKITKWATQASAATGGNIATGQLIKAADAAAEAPEGKRMSAFTGALSDLTIPDAAVATAFGLHSSFPVLRERPKIPSPPVAPEVLKQATTLTEAGAPQTAAAVLETAPKIELPPVEIPFTEGPTETPEQAARNAGIAAPEIKLVTETDHAGNETHRLDVAKETTPEQLTAFAANLDTVNLPEAAKNVVKTQLNQELAARSPAPATPVAGPAIVDAAGKILTQGTVGQTHADLMKASLGTPQEEAVVNAFAQDKQHAFVDSQGNVLDREQGAKAAVANGQADEGTTSLHSQDLKAAPVEPLNKPAFTGATIADWYRLEGGEKLPTTASIDEAYADKFTRRGVKIEFKPEATLKERAPGDHRVTGEVSLADVERVIDSRGRILYEAGKPPTPEAVARRQAKADKAAKIAPQPEPITPQPEPIAPQPELIAPQPESPQIGEATTTETHPATGEKLPVTIAGGKVEPTFTNDPDITAQQIDMGKRVYIPDEIMDTVDIDPRIGTTFDKKLNKFYVTRAEHSKYGEIKNPNELTDKYNNDPSVQERKLAQTGGAWKLTQEGETRQAALAKLKPAGGSPEAEQALVDKYMPSLERRLANETREIEQQVGGADVPRLRDALQEELRWNLRKRPGKEPPLFSIFTSTRNNFLRLAGRNQPESLDVKLGDSETTHGDVLTAEQDLTKTGIDPVEQALIDRNIPSDLVEHDAKDLPQGEFATPDWLSVPGREVDAEAIKNNVDTLQRIGLLEKSPNVGAALQKLSTDTGVPEHQRLLARVIARQLEAAKIKLNLVNNPDAEFAGIHKYLPDGGSEVTLNLGTGHQAGITGTLLHELDHSLTVAKLHPDYQRNSVEQKAVDNLTRLWDTASRKLFEFEYGRAPSEQELTDWRKAQESGAEPHPQFNKRGMYYGAQSLIEFVTEVKGSPAFQRILASLPEQPGVPRAGRKFRSILDAVREWLNNLFVGAPVKKGSLLDQALNESLKLSTSGPIDLIQFGIETGEAHSRSADYRIRLKQENSETIFGDTGPILNFPTQLPGTPWYNENFGSRKPGDITQAEVNKASKKIKAGDVFSELEKAALEREINKEPSPNGPGWLARDGEFLPAEEGIVAVGPQVIGGHEEAAMKWMEKNDPASAQKFEREIRSGSAGNWSLITDYMEKKGFVRLVSGGGEGHTIYITGKPAPSQLKILKDMAVENKADLVHDIGGASRVLFSPQEAFSPAGSAQPRARVITEFTGGKTTRRLDIEDGATRAQVQQLSDTIGNSTMPKEEKARLQQEIAVALGPTLEIKAAGDKVVAGYDSANNIANVRSRQKANELALDFGSSTKPTPEQLLDRSAMPFVIEAAGDKHQLEIDRDRIANSKDKDKELAAEFGPVIEHALANFDRLDPRRAKVADLNKEQLERERSVGIPTKELDNYIARVLEQPENRDAMVPASQGNRFWLKGRRFEKLSDAIYEGYRPTTTDVVDLTRRRIELGERAVQMKVLENTLRTIKAPDNKPIIGNTEEVETLMGNKERVTPPGYVTVQTGAKPLVVHQDFAKIFQALYGDSSVPQLLKDYTGYAKRYTLAADTFHVGRMTFKELAYSRGAQRFGYGKGISLLEYADADLDKAVATGDISQKMADYTREKIDLPKALREQFPEGLTRRDAADMLLKNGLNVGRVLDNVFAENVKHIPFLGGFNDWVFQKLSRGMMLQSAIENLSRNLSRFPERGVDGNLRQTAKEMNEVFGNLQNQSWAKNKTLQDTLRAIVLAPNWAESQLKAEARGYGQIGRSAWDAAHGNFRLGVVGQGQLTVVVGMLLANQVINYLTTGHSTFENKEGHKLDAFIPGGARGFFFNPFEIGAEYAFMAQRYFSQHMTPIDVLTQIASNKLSPVGRGVKTLITGRDYAGRPFESTPDRIRGALTDALPLPIAATAVLEKDPRQPLGYRVSRQMGGEQRLGSIEKQLLQSAGLKVAPDFSPRNEMFALAHPFREDQSYKDPSPYKGLRDALDNNQLEAARAEIKLLAGRGKTLDQIRTAAPSTRENFTGTLAKEHEFKKQLTPDQRAIYEEAQADHKALAHRLRPLLSELRPELREQDKKNKMHQRGRDVE